MTRLRCTSVLVLAVLVGSTQALLAEVRADQKTRAEFGGLLGSMMNIFGGKGAKDGVTSSVAVKGDRKATMSEQTGQIIDLNEEKVYDLDLKKKTYKVTTFDELRRRMEEAQKKAEDNARKEQPKAAPAPNPDAKQMEVDVDIKNTGQTRTINGFNTHETVMTITFREMGKTVNESGGMIVTTDMWLAPKIAEMKEITDFDLRYAQKLYGGMLAGVSAEQMAAAAALYPMMKQALARTNVEGGKVDGTSILTTMTMDAVKSDADVAEQTKQQQQDAQPTPDSGVNGFLSGLAKKAVAKKSGGDDVKQRATFMTTTAEVLKVATDVTAADLAIPAGFKENK